MKLTIEVGPLEQYENRLKLLCKLEENGVTIKERKKMEQSLREFTQYIWMLKIGRIKMRFFK